MQSQEYYGGIYLGTGRCTCQQAIDLLQAATEDGPFIFWGVRPEEMKFVKEQVKNKFEIRLLNYWYGGMYKAIRI